MTAEIDLVALSLLPLWRWRRIAEQLKAGQSAGDILEQQCAELPRGKTRGTEAGELRTEASSALARTRISICATPPGNVVVVGGTVADDVVVEMVSVVVVVGCVVVETVAVVVVVGGLVVLVVVVTPVCRISTPFP